MAEKKGQTYSNKDLGFEDKTQETFTSADLGFESPQKAIKGNTTAGMSFLRGAGQSSSLGFGDELYGAVAAALPGLTGSTKGSYSERYAEARDYARRKDLQAESDNPKAYMGGALTGGALTAFAPGLGALNAGKGAKAAEVIGKGAATGAITGVGSSDASPITNPEGLAAAGLKGGLLGGAAAGTFRGLGAAAGAAKKTFTPTRTASVLLGAPESAIERYMANRGAVNAAKPREQLTKELMESMEKFKEQRVLGGSSKSREILDEEGVEFAGDELADIFASKANQLKARSEGVWDDPTQEATYAWLKSMEAKYRPKAFVEGEQDLVDAMARDPEAVQAMGMKPPEEIGGVYHEVLKPGDIERALRKETERTLSANRIKDLVQNLQRKTQYEVQPGKFADTDDLIRKDMAAQVNALLKGRSEAYTKQMDEVAKDTAVLNEVSDLAGSPQAMDSLLKRIQQERAFFPAETLSKFDKANKSNFAGQLKDSFTKEAFDRGATNGSRNVNLYSKAFAAVGQKLNLPFSEAIGAGVGAIVDKYGPKIGKKMVDTTIDVRRIINSSSAAQRLGKFAGPLAKAAKEGNHALAVTHLTFMQDPDYRRRVLRPESAIDRRLQGDN